MKRHLLTLMAVLMSSIIYAATALQMGEVFTIKDGGDDVWTITPTESGVMKIVGDNGDGEWIGSCLVVYADEAMTNQVQSYNWTYYEVNVEAGHTYYIKNSNLSFMDFKGHCTMAEAFAFVRSVPAEGEPFYIEGDTEASFYFTVKNVTFKTGELECNGQKVNIYNFVDQNELISNGTFTYTEIGSSGVVNYNGNVVGHSNNDGFSIPFLTSTGLAYTNVIYDWLASGKIEPGQTMTIKIHGVCSGNGELLNGDGELEMHWLVAELPTTLDKSTLPETFLSYWVPGDENGIAVFEFSREIKSAQAGIAMGYADASDRFEGEVPVIIDGKKVKIDLTGEKRNKETMGLKSIYPQMELKLYNVIDIYGNGTFAGDQGRASSYDFVMSYRDVSGEVEFEFNPETGNSLEGVSSIELWYQDLKGIIEADGVEVIYYTTEIEKETVAEVVEGEEITREVEVEVNKEHTIFYGDQELGANWNVGVDGTTITIPVTDEIHNAKNVSVRLHITKCYDGRDHNIVAYYNTTLFHEYEVALTADPLSESTVDRLAEIYLTLGSTYSINKDKATVSVTSKTNMQYEATGTIVKDGMTNAKIVLDEPITEEGQYTITIQEGALGDYIYGESGYTSGNCNQEVVLFYTVSGNYAGKDIVAEPEASSTVNKLDEISLTYFIYNVVAPSWNPDAVPYVIAGDDVDNPIACHFVESENITSTVTVKLDSPITAEGEYTLVIPAGAVCNAATGDVIATEYTFSYTVTGEVIVADKPSVNPEEGEYDELSTITITFNQPVTWDDSPWAFIMVPEIIDENGNAYPGEIEKGENEGEVIFNTYDPVVKAGTYTLKVYAEAFIGADGKELGEQVYTYTYTITGANDTPSTPIEVPTEFGALKTDPADGATVASIQAISLDFENEWAMVGCIEGKNIELLDANGNVVATAWNGVEMDMDWETFEIKGYNINFEEAITTPGTYKLVMPLSVMAADWVTIYEETIVVTLTIDTADNINTVKAQSGAAYTIGGIKANANKPGLYIVNGKKVMINK